MPYHASLYIANWHKEYFVDLSKEDILNSILIPFKEKQHIFIQDKFFFYHTITEIQITFTKKYSRELNSVVEKQIAEEYKKYQESTSMIDAPFIKSKEERIMMMGKDITNKLFQDVGLISKNKFLRTKHQVEDPKQIFIINGRNIEILNELNSFLRAAGLIPLDWEYLVRLTGQGSPYIGDVLDRGFEVSQAAIVLLTPDDVAALRRRFWKNDDSAEEINLSGQARINVYFEAGMAMAKYPDNTIFVQIGQVRSYSDIGGRHIIKFDGTEKKRENLLDRLASVGCLVDKKNEDWKKIGNFVIKDYKHGTPLNPLAEID
jgi:predicted nucleotide-binding protein